MTYHTCPCCGKKTTPCMDDSTCSTAWMCDDCTNATTFLGCGDMAAIGPRRPGGVYYSGYWQQQYEVLAVHTRVRPADAGGYDNLGWYITIKWIPTEFSLPSPYPSSEQWRDDFYRVTTHCTRWDPRRDKIIRLP